ncbi:hypothetical protein CRN79_12860 [Serratia fonticola]|nr:hypothetical protein CRN79_12860 [Serratia fonticola]MBC3220845.1 hypothetical protein [Serratia fonticola]MBC3230897.1 hypothetical protein [Serratia fonticola]NCG54314.1 hypothetical protein [Serratia fonticola]
MHNPCAVTYVLNPNVMTVRKVSIDIELTGSLTLGMTVADLRFSAPADCNTQVAMKLDRSHSLHLPLCNES